MIFCNRCCSLCCLVLSGWGVVQLLVLGALYWFHSVALLPDLPGMDEQDIFQTFDEFAEAADKSYRQAALNCWIAVVIYIVSFLVSGHQFYLNTLKNKVHHTVDAKMVFCNLCCSLCCTIISCWGIIQLFVMGLLYWIHSVALVEDLLILESYPTFEAFEKAAEKGYRDAAISCWVSAAIYVVSFLVSGHQFYLNTRSK